MIRKSLFGIAASMMTLGAFSGTLALLTVGTVPAAIEAQIA